MENSSQTHEITYVQELRPRRVIVQVRRIGARASDIGGVPWASAVSFAADETPDEPHVARRIEAARQKAQDWIDSHVDTTPVGIAEIAERLGTTRNTVDAWRRRDTGFPEPAWTVGGRPAWPWSAIEAWAQATGRA